MMMDGEFNLFDDWGRQHKGNNLDQSAQKPIVSINRSWNFSKSVSSTDIDNKSSLMNKIIKLREANDFSHFDKVF